jgi:hypothetical protein
MYIHFLKIESRVPQRDGLGRRAARNGISGTDTPRRRYPWSPVGINFSLFQSEVFTHVRHFPLK